jgi:heme/copper-type cytochrome/quinol oxidase subunit 2
LSAVRRWGLPALALAAFAAAAAAGPDVAVRVSKRGFEPSRITLRRGETTRLVLPSGDGEHCFAIDALRVEKRVVPGRATPFDLTPGRAGVFPFYCCLESGEAARIERGELTVTE